MRSLISFLSSVRWIIRLIGFLMHSYRWWAWKDRNITSVNPKRISWLQMSFLAPKKRGEKCQMLHKSCIFVESTLQVWNFCLNIDSQIQIEELCTLAGGKNNISAHEKWINIYNNKLHKKFYCNPSNAIMTLNLKTQ